MVGQIKKYRPLYLGLVLLAILVFITLKQTRSLPVNIGQIENIDGIAFPVQSDQVVITEKLAHADLYLDHSPFARALVVTVTFKPLETSNLSLGIRENAFWLSYPKISICCDNTQKTALGSSLTSSATIPLTDKIIDKNGSVDLMFFSSNPTSSGSEDEGTDDQTVWILEDLTVTSVPALPTYHEIKDYIKAIVTKERPL